MSTRKVFWITWGNKDADRAGHATVESARNQAWTIVKPGRRVELFDCTTDHERRMGQFDYEHLASFQPDAEYCLEAIRRLDLVLAADGAADARREFLRAWRAELEAPKGAQPNA